MLIREKIEKICNGREVRIFRTRPEGSVTFVESYRNCGKPSCIRCRDKSNRPHGPYWTLNYADEKGIPRTLYVGRKLPHLDLKAIGVQFADVVRYLEESQRQKESILRLNRELQSAREELQMLYEEIRTYRRSARKGISVQAEKFFKQLVRKYHPDRNATKVFTAEDVMKDINQLFQKFSAHP